MIKYKLLSQDMKSYKNFLWEIGATVKIEKEGNRLCSEDVFHFYDHPALAVIFNPIHAQIKNPRLFEIEVEDIVSHDGMKGGCKQATLVKEIPIPKISLEQRVEFAIKVSLLVYTEKSYVLWAENWLNGEDRTIKAAEAASKDVLDAWFSTDIVLPAPWSAWSAAKSATETAETTVKSAVVVAETTAKAAAESAICFTAKKSDVAEVKLIADIVSKKFVEIIENILRGRNDLQALS